MAISPAPPPVMVRFHPTPATTLSAVSRAPGWTAYHYRGELIGRYRGTDPAAHYGRVVRYLVGVMGDTRRTETPWRDANLIWMAVSRSGG